MDHLSKNMSLEQLDLNVRALLSSFWNVPSIEGTERNTRSSFTDPLIRAELTALVGAPHFQIVSWWKLKELSRIPRSSDGHQVCNVRTLLRPPTSRNIAVLHEGQRALHQGV